MNAKQVAAQDRPWKLNLGRAALLIGAFLTGLYLSDRAADDEADEAPPIRCQSLAQVDR